MSWEQVQRNWPRFCGKVQARWNDLSEMDVQAIDGYRDRLRQELEVRYALSEEQAKREIDQFLRRCKWGVERFEHCLESLFAAT